MSQKIKSSIYFAVLVIACVMYLFTENTDDNQKDYTNTANETMQQGTVYNSNYIQLD
tara:strand:- start:172882 stop:173052 length:171 start_codon:yes stop_codon:yes gene_type:complete